MKGRDPVSVPLIAYPHIRVIEIPVSIVILPRGDKKLQLNLSVADKLLATHTYDTRNRKVEPTVSSTERYWRFKAEE